MHRKERLIAGLAAAAALWLWPAAIHAELFEGVSAERLNNGMPVILLENHKAPVITFQVWYRTGSRHDPWGKSGLAHVLEHMMFKGTKQFSGEAFTSRIHETGGSYNAFTAHDFAGYYETMAVEKIELAMKLEADRMQHLLLVEDEFKTEVNVVMEERRMRVDDSPSAFLAEQLNAMAFQATPYHWPVIGWMQDLQRLTVEDARGHYRKYYQPGNAFIVAVGDFQKEDFKARVAEYFGDIPVRDRPEHFRYHEPLQTGERRAQVRLNAQVPAVIMGYHVPTIGDADAYVLEVIAAVLSAGKSSRLHKTLVLEKEIAISADAGNSLLSIDPNLFYLSAQPMHGKTVEELEQALVEQLDHLKKKAVETRELTKAKNQLATGFVFSQDSLFYQAMLLARYEIAGGWERIKAYMPSIRQVSAEDIMRVAAKYFVPENRNVGVLQPLPVDSGRMVSTDNVLLRPMKTGDAHVPH